MTSATAVQPTAQLMGRGKCHEKSTRPRWKTDLLGETLPGWAATPRSPLESLRVGGTDGDALGETGSGPSSVLSIQRERADFPGGSEHSSPWVILPCTVSVLGGGRC